MGTGTCSIQCRTVLWILVSCGFAVNYILRNNLNIAIVAMVSPQKVPGMNDSTSTSNLTSYDDQFQWNEYHQALALGAYYWLHWVTQLPGGLLARLYGTKLVFGIGNLLVALLGFAVPLATRYDFNGLLVIRVLQGLVAGAVWPSMHDMTAKWIPANERSRFVSSYMGSSVGAAITYPLCSALIQWYGWESAFYVTSIIGMVWYCFWLYLVYDSPNQHPRISEEEKKYILDNLDTGNDEEARKVKNKRVPWKKILLSWPLWVTIIAHWGGIWGFITLMTHAPTYLFYIQGWNMNQTGLLSGLPHIARMVFSYTFSMFCDWLLKSQRMTLTNVRKLANLICTGGMGVVVSALIFSGKQPIFAAIWIIIGTALNGAVSSGTIPLMVDLNPNYASILFGLCNLVTAPAGFLAPLVVGVLTNGNQTNSQWQLVFLIAAVNLGASCIVHLIFGTAEEQHWDDDQSGNSKDQAETDSFIIMKPANNKTHKKLLK